MAGKGDWRRPTDAAHAIDCSRGHALPDVKGKCWRCGEQIAEPRPAAPPEGEWQTGENGHRSIALSQYEKP